MHYKSKHQNSNLGITLIALVITVIVLLILATVALSLITGQNGLFARANHAGMEFDTASRIEVDQVTGLNTYLDQYMSEGDFASGNIRLTLSDANITPEPITATLSTSSGYGIQYQINGSEEGNWNTYSSPLTITENCSVYARTVNGESYGEVQRTDITNIGVAGVNGIGYPTLSDAIVAAEDGVDTVVLGTNIEIDSNYIIMKSIGLYLRGFTITETGCMIETSGNITIQADAGGKIVSDEEIAIVNISSSTTTLNNLTVISTANNAVVNYSTGKIVINGGTYTSNGSYVAILNQSTGSMELNNCTVNAPNSYAIANNGSAPGSITLTNCTVNNISNSSCAVYNVSSGTISIASGSYDVTTLNGAIRNQAGGTINISGGTIANHSKQTIINYAGGTINISGGSLSAGDSNCIYNNGAGSVNILGASTQIEASTTDYATIINSSSGPITIGGGTIRVTNGMVISNLSSGIITINDGTITRTGSTPGILIRNSNTSTKGNLVINGGTLTNTEGHVICNVGIGDITISGGTLQTQAGTYKLIYLAESNSIVNIYGGRLLAYNGYVISSDSTATGVTVTLGRNDGTINRTSPELSTTNSYYDISIGDGTLNFYDGILKGAGIDAGTINTPSGTNYTTNTSVTPYETTIN